MLWCMHFHKNIWILGKVSSFHMHLPWNPRSGRGSMARRYALLRSKEPLGEGFQANLSSFLLIYDMGVACNSFLTSLGSSIWSRSEFQPPNSATSLILRLKDSSVRGPWMMFLNIPRFDQLSCQKLRLLSYLGIHLIPFLNISSPFFMLFQVWEQGRLASFLEFNLWCMKYFNHRTLAHWDLPSVWNLQFNLIYVNQMLVVYFTPHCLKFGRKCW